MLIFTLFSCNLMVHRDVGLMQTVPRDPITPPHMRTPIISGSKISSDSMSLSPSDPTYVDFRSAFFGELLSSCSSWKETLGGFNNKRSKQETRLEKTSP